MVYELNTIHTHTHTHTHARAHARTHARTEIKPRNWDCILSD